MHRGNPHRIVRRVKSIQRVNHLHASRNNSIKLISLHVPIDSNQCGMNLSPQADGLFVGLRKSSVTNTVNDGCGMTAYQHPQSAQEPQ